MLSETAMYKAKQLRYKKPALVVLSWDVITNELYEISEQCDTTQWALADEDALLNALGGNEEEAFEFRMAFVDLSASAEQLQQALSDCYIEQKTFDVVMVGLLGNKYASVGYDDYEEDYYGLTGFEQELASKDSGKWLMQFTKAKMISMIGQCLGISIAFLDLRQKYDYLRAAFDVLKDENHSLLDLIRDIEDAYVDAEGDEFYSYRLATKRFDMLVSGLPDSVWVE